jgi:hydrogenase/urease accessory protein HupE
MPPVILRYVLLCLALLAASVADAHRLRPAIVTVTFGGEGEYRAEIVLNMEAVLVGIGPEHADTNESPKAGEYDALRMLPPDILEQRIRRFAPDYLASFDLRFDGQRVSPALTGIVVPEVGDLGVERLTTLTLTGQVPAGAGEFTWAWAPALGESALRLGTPADGLIRSEWLTAGQVSEPFPLSPGMAQALSTGQVFADYTWLGFTHILPKGIDHILFVLGIFLLSLHWRPLLYQVTAFTLAHSITLALSLYGLVSLPSSVVEPLIALSIVYVAVENVITRELKPWRVYVVFAFGLLHGLGFAGVLTELGLPRNEFLTALIAFNVGVELGQLAVISMAFLAVGLWFRDRTWYRAGIVIPGSALIALVGAYWTLERVFG